MSLFSKRLVLLWSSSRSSEATTKGREPCPRGVPPQPLSRRPSAMAAQWQSSNINIPSICNLWSAAGASTRRPYAQGLRPEYQNWSRSHSHPHPSPLQPPSPHPSLPLILFFQFPVVWRPSRHGTPMENNGPQRSPGRTRLNESKLTPCFILNPPSPPQPPFRDIEHGRLCNKPLVLQINNTLY